MPCVCNKPECTECQGPQPKPRMRHFKINYKAGTVTEVSKPTKAKRDRPTPYDRLIAIASRCVPFVNPKTFASEMAKTRPIADCYLNTLLRRAVNAAKRDRRIAKRLEWK